ncbi:hypothetical protein CEXT_62491 [Caerostris extrusa]|uniref:Uncharacterized protein n=1 Tax=Caerostris extrusa TaxID=172846 RepID=A0AAV4MBB5_CAEEX|nr:hypothetical protein CEXT_62491 [Caerostris extrusa]
MSPFIHMSGSLPTITIPTSLLFVETQVISIPTQSFHTSSLICCLAERPLIITRNTSERVIPRNWTTLRSGRFSPCSHCAPLTRVNTKKQSKEKGLLSLAIESNS